MGKLGKHVILDAVVKHPEHFTVSKLTSLFEELAKALDMHILQGPTFVEVELDSTKLTGDEFQDDGGITGMCVISTSHFALHAWTLRKYFSMDIFSCKPYTAQTALTIVDDFFGITHNKITILDRVAPDNDQDFKSMYHDLWCCNQNFKEKGEF